MSGTERESGTSSGAVTRGEGDSGNSPGGAGPGASHPPLAENTSYKELMKRLRASGVADDALAESIARNWQKMLGGVAVLILLFWVVSEYREAQRTTLGEAATAFEEVQELYERFIADVKQGGGSGSSNRGSEQGGGEKPDQSGTRVRKGLEESLASVVSRYAGTSYGKLAKLYSGALALQEGKLEQARAELKGFHLSAYETPVEAFNPGDRFLGEGFYDEFAALLFARSLLEEEGKRFEGRERLKQLAFTARVVGIEAMIAFIRSAQNEEERAAAEATARTLYEQMNSPRSQEQRKLLESALEEIGVTVAESRKSGGRG